MGVHSAFHLNLGYKLDHAVHHRGQSQGHQMDPFLLLPERAGLP